MAEIRDPWRWRPLTGIPPDAHEWLAPEYEELAAEWGGLKERLAKDPRAAAFVGKRLLKRQREFAVETGAIERLYHLRRGVTQHLVAEGLHTAIAAHTVEGVRTETLRGLLVDQEAALERVYRDTAADADISPSASRSPSSRTVPFRDTAADADISPAMVKGWHALLVKHQETVTGVTKDGVLGQVPFDEKGVWKTQPNNPSIPGKGVFEYCPPERLSIEMDRLCTLYGRIRQERYPVHAEAAWLHHRFVRTHPFQDGNGRVSRLLMASCYSRRGLVPPLLRAEGREDYFDTLQRADAGDLRSFSRYIAVQASAAQLAANTAARNALAGRLDDPPPNGARTVGETYHEPP